MTEQDSFRTKEQIIFYDYINNTHTFQSTSTILAAPSPLAAPLIL